MNYYWTWSSKTTLTLWAYNEPTGTYTKEELLKAHEKVKSERYLNERIRQETIAIFKQGLDLFNRG